MPSLSFANQIWENAKLSEPENKTLQLSQDLSISPTLARLLSARGLHEAEHARTYLNPQESDCPDPFLLREMRIAVERIFEALQRREHVIIYGDHDVDGITSTCILHDYFQKVGILSNYFIPDRLKDGRGLNEASLTELRKQCMRLVVTVDTGSSSCAEARLLKEWDVDLIITDHHQVGKEEPECVALVNPHHPECNYPFTSLAGAGVAYKLACALDLFLTEQNFWGKTGLMRPSVKRYLDWVALATIADQVPLIAENRFFVIEGLELMNQDPRCGIQALTSMCNVRGYISSNIVSSKFAPKINAAGHLGDPNVAMRVLLAHSLSEARPHVRKLLKLSTHRKRLEDEAFSKALSQVPEQESSNAIMVFDETWHQGVLGNMAGKLARSYNKTSAVLTQIEGERVVGSLRGIPAVNLYQVLQECSDLLEKFGGHPAAAGFTVPLCNLDEFFKRFRASVDAKSEEEQDNPPLNIDVWVTQEQFNQELIQDLLKMAPFGKGNPEPVVGVLKTSPQAVTPFGNTHLRFHIASEKKSIEIIAWGHSGCCERLKGVVDIAVSPQPYGGSSQNSNLQFRMLDFREP